MVLAELQAVASGLGISGTGKLRKGALIEAISAAQNGGSQAAARSTSSATTERAARVDSTGPSPSRGGSPAESSTRAP